MNYPSSYGQLIHEGPSCAIFRSDSEKILKVLYPNGAQDSEDKFLKNEHGITHNLNIPGVRKALALRNIDDKPALELEYIEGATLKEWLIDKQTDLGEFLRVALSLTNTVEKLHQLQIVHRHLTSENILINRQQEVTLIDFSLARKNHQSSQDSNDFTKLEGVAAYISPEQTGRIDRRVDERSDLYSLGVIFYELFTGQLPFTGKDTLELVHAHIAQTPVAPRAVSDVPPVLSEIILKLLKKSADDRYQSCFGLKHDLQQCLKQWEARGKISSFPLAENDFSGKFQLPQALYGREKETTQLLRLFERACAGPTQLIFISGYAGVGKTSLVQKLFPAITEKRGYFISGKFDQYHRDIPYYAWVQAFEAFVQQVLTESRTQLEYWKENIQRAVEPHGRLLTDVVSDLKILIGEQPEVSMNSPTDRQHLLNQTVISFVKAISRSSHPLFVFIDDWQWADFPSLDLLQAVATDQETQFVMLAGTYRDNEVDTFHPLSQRLSDIKKEHREVREMLLQDLEPRHVTQLIADTLRAPAEACRPLAELVYTKTRGNPFFVRQILHTVYEANLLRYNAAHKRWDWELEAIRQLNITDNVVALMAGKVRQLPSAVQQVLQLAACIGTLFSIDTLSVIYEKSLAETATDLQRPLRDDLIIQVKDHYKFVHDRIQQAVYSLIPEQERNKVHLRIGRLLLHSVRQQPEAEILLNEQLFNIVNQLNAGRTLIESPEERLDLAELNLRAGLKAKSAPAFPAATRYFTTGIELLPPDAWQQHYDLTFQLYEQCADCEFLVMRETASEKHYNVILKHAKTTLEKADILSTQVWQYIGVYRMEEAYQKAAMGLQLCGTIIPQTEKDMQRENTRLAAKIKASLEQRPLDEFIQAPFVTDQSHIVQMRNCYALAWHSFYGAHLARFTFSVQKGVLLSLQLGQFELSSNMFAMYCRILALNDRYREAYQSAKLAIELASRNKARGQTLAYCRAALWGLPYGEHLQNAIPVYKKAAEVGWEMGDLVQSCPNNYDIAVHMLHQGSALPEVEKAAEKSAEYCKKVHFELGRDAGLIEQRVASYLQNRERANDLSDESFSGEQLQRIRASIHSVFLWFSRIQIRFWFEEYEEAYQLARDTSHLLNLGTNIKWADYDFYYALVCAQRVGDAPVSDQQLLHQEISQAYAKIKLRAEACPDNFRHKQYLLEAEMARLARRKWEAADLYDQAIAEANRYDFTHIEALAYELAAKCWKAYEKHDFASVYFQHARRCYQRWGSAAKVHDLEAKYPRYFLHKIRLDENGILSQDVRPDGEESYLPTWDFRSIIMSIQAISSEIVLSSLLEKMIQNVVESAGAERGALIENKEGDLRVLATGDVRGEVQVLSGVPIEQYPDLPLSVVHWVARVRKPLVLDHASRNTRYAHDPYFQSQQSRSVLSIPIQRKGKLMAIFYLENNLVAGAFSAERLELLKILSTQIAISLENALLYENRLESEKIHEIEKAKSRFFANVSHEFRTPLTLILGLVKKMQKGTIPEDQRSEQYPVVIRNAERLRDLINQLLDLSRLEAKTMQLEVAQHRIAQFMRGIIQSFEVLARQKNLDFEYTLPDQRISGLLDADKLHKIISNLLNNAIKFTPENGQVVLEVSSKAPNYNWVRITVRDTGPGIPPHEIDQLFERFYQAESTNRLGLGGSGLGLSLTRELVELHKGKITARRAEEVGMEFTVDIPVGSAYYTSGEIVNQTEFPPVKAIVNPVSESSLKREVLTDKKAKGRKRVLVVEDHQDLRQFISGILQNDYKVSQASEGAEGLERATEEIPDLIISDIMMPKMDGYTLCENLKSDVRTSHIPVILLTAKADVFSKVEGLETGADDYITKPFHESELLARVKNLIRQRDQLKGLFAQNIQVAPQELTVNSQDQRFLERAMEIAEEQLANPQFGVSDFCQQIGMSRPQLYRKLNALTGFSANEFMREMRLKRATSLLDQQFGSVTEIAFETGFSSLSYFSKCFHRRFGVSPKEYNKTLTSGTKA